MFKLFFYQLIFSRGVGPVKRKVKTCVALYHTATVCDRDVCTSYAIFSSAKCILKKSISRVGYITVSRNPLPVNPP